MGLPFVNCQTPDSVTPDENEDCFSADGRWGGSYAETSLASNLTGSPTRPSRKEGISPTVVFQAVPS